MTSSSQPEKKICITGANGFIGRILLNELTKKGYSIKILTRNAEKIFSNNVDVVIGDLTKSDCPLEEFVRDADILINCAGEIHRDDQMRLLHVDGTKSLLDAVSLESQKTGRKIHWVQLSSCGAYGPPKIATQQRIVTESSPTNPDNEYEVTKTIADELIVEAGNTNGLSYAILRPSNVFGNSMKDRSLPKLVNMVKTGKFFFLGKPGTITTYVHVNDVVNALILLSEDERAKQKIFNLSSDCTIEALVAKIAEFAKIDQPKLRIPAALVRTPLIIIAALLKKFMHVPKLDALVLRTEYPSHKIELELGFQFSKPMPNAVKDLI